jgi:hypothetical protein
MMGGLVKSSGIDKLRRTPARGRFCAALGYGETLLGKLRVRETGKHADNPAIARSFEPPPGSTERGGIMDLAMAMAVALFGMFAVSTIYFFYKLES